MQPAEGVIRSCALGGGVTATVTDESRHYFGGYYHVRIQVRADIPVSEAAFSDPSCCRDAVRRLGPTVRFSRILEKMAVPEGEIDAVRRHLLEAFDTNLLPYLMRDDFADSFVRSEYRNALKPGSSFPRPPA